jgi:hypothetical protein
MSAQKPKQDVKVKIFASSKQQKSYDRRDEERITDVIRNEVLPKVKPEYHSVSVKVERNVDGTPKSLVAYMLRKDTYTADVAKVVIDQDYKVQEVQENYDDSLEVGDEAEEEVDYAEPPAEYDAVDFVAGTPVPEIQTAKAAVEAVAQLAANIGLTPKVLLGPDASVANYKHALKSGLHGFVNVGHGYPGGIVLDDGRLRSTWFDGLTNEPLSPAVVYFNSCKVHNPPLQPAVMSAGARTYIGGIVNLLIGPSEKVCQCFWTKALIDGWRMEDALKQCELDNYPRTGDHGISGDLEKFRAGHIIVFQHVNFRGHHRHIFWMENNLNHPEDNSLNDQISSFAVISGTWKLYQHSNFIAQLGGKYGPGEYRWVEAVGVKNDQVSSLRCIKA